MRRALPLTIAGALAAMAALAAAAPSARAMPAAAAGPAAPDSGAYAAPSGAWDQFTSDLNSAGGVATGQGVTVAVLSTGLDTSARGLAGKVTEGPNYIGSAAQNDHTEGTVLASIILGVPGVIPGAAPDVRILSLRVVPDQSEKGYAKFFGSSDFSATEGPILAKAITYAVAHGARVIEVDQEVGGDATADLPLANAVSAAIAKGAVIVAPEYGYKCQTSCDYQYPAGLPGVIGVASTMLPGGISASEVVPDSSDSPESADESALNNSVLIAGPGDWVQATPDGWGLLGVGTAAAYVTSTVALIKERYPSLSPGLVARALAMSARDKPSGGYSTQVGFGVLDPYDAVLDAGTLARLTTSAAPGPGVVGAKARFGPKSLPAVINALPSAEPEIIGYWAATGVGVVLLVLAVIVAIRGRRKRRDPSADSV